MVQKSGLEKKELSNLNIHLCSHEFCRPFSFDGAPGGHRCEWCGEPAEKHVTQLLADLESGMPATNSSIRFPGEESQRRKAEILSRGILDLEEPTYAFLMRA